MSEQPFMKFEIREKVQHFKDDRTFNELENLELQPIVKVHQSDNKIEITGHLVLNGEFTATVNEDTEWVEEFDQADGIHYGDFFEQEQEVETFQYQIPLSIQLQSDRVENIEQLFVLVEQFDYALLSSEEIELTAYIKLLGVHPEPKQEKPIDGLDEYDEVAGYQQAQEYYEVVNVDATNEEQEEAEYQAEVEETTITNEVEAVEDVEVVQNESEVTEVTDEVEEVEEVEVVQNETEIVEEETEEVFEPKAKVKIGIKGNSRERKTNQDTSSTNLLYSLFGNKKVDKTETVNVEDDEAEQEQAPAEIVMVTEEENVETIANEVEEVRETEVAEEIVEASEEETEEATKTANYEDSTKNMLFNLISGNEEKKYTLKMYFVQKEDTIETIAEKYQLNANEIILYNQLQGQEIGAGQILYLPNNG